MESKSYVIIMFTPEIRYKNYVRITSGSYARFTLGKYVIKPCMGTKIYVIIT